MTTLRSAVLLVVVSAVAGSLAGGPAAGLHAAATAALFIGSAAVAVTVVGADRIRRHQPAPAEDAGGGSGHLVHDLLLARYARRGAIDVHTRLRPQLRRVATTLLAARHGLALDDPRHAAAIEALVGPDAWDLIRPDRGPPRQRSAAGLHRGQLDGLLSGLERL